MSVSYLYADNRIRTANGVVKPDGSSTPRESAEASTITRLEDKNNPVYNFTSDFVSQFQNISSTDIAMAVPYLRLSSLGANGEVLEDYNLQFFHKTIDMANVSGPARFSDRPTMSLKSVRLHTDAAQGTIALTKVSIALKVHRADDYINGSLLSLMMPGTMMRLVYGWNSTNATLNERDVLLFNISQYFITLDTSGQLDLNVEGLTQMQSFGATLLGDIGEPVALDDLVNDEQAANIANQKQRVETYTAHIKQSKQGRSTSRNLDVVRKQAKATVNAKQRAVPQIRRRFANLFDQLRRKKKSDGYKFITEKRRKTNTLSHGEYVTVHDVIKTLCGSTLDALHGTFVPSSRQFRVVYGAFNGTLETFANRSIADFPLSWNDFSRRLSEMSANGSTIPTLNAMFTMIADFIKDPMYWRNNLISQNEEVTLPNITIQFGSHLSGEQEVIQLTIIDTKKDIPHTISKINGVGKSQASQKEIEDAVTNGEIPIIALGHANTFVKTVNIQSDNDEQMRAVQIAKAQKRLSERIPTAKQDVDVKENPLFLPLNGSMDVLGHVEWKPFRFFFLRTGLYLVDAIYCITSVEHEIDAAGFKTKITFRYH